MLALFASLFCLVVTFKETWEVQPIEDILEQQRSSWCKAHPWGVVYSLGLYYSCEMEYDEPRVEEKSLKGVVLRVGVLENNDDYDYDCKCVLEGGKWEAVDNYSQYILSLLQDILQFEIILVPSNTWSYYGRNRTGLTGLIATNSTDLTICHWAMTDHISEIADYLYPTMQTTESFVYLPQSLPLSQDIFVETFSRRLWIFFLLSIFLLIVSFRFSTFMHSKIRPDHEPWRWDEVILWAVAAISQQSYSRHPRGSSCRTTFLIGYTITYLLYTGFAAGITSLLALQSHQGRLTFDDVVGMNLKLLHHQDEYHPNLESAEPRLARLLSNEGDNLSQIFSKLEESNFVGFGSTVTFVNYLRRKVEPKTRARFLVSQVPNSRWQKAFLVRKSFPYKDVFNYWLLRLAENGLLDLGERRFLKSDEVSRYKSGEWLSVSLGNVLSAVVFLIGGWFLSLLVLALEIFWSRRKNFFS